MNTEKSQTELNIKKSYHRLRQKQLDSLNSYFNKNQYPNKEETNEISKSLGLAIAKIENWFKHKRRMSVIRGFMKFERKKAFSKEENAILLEEFQCNRNPKEKKYKELAQKFDCQVKNIKNWFSYRRKKSLRNKKKGTVPKIAMNSLSEIKQEETIQENINFNVPQNQIRVKIEDNSLKNTINHGITQNNGFLYAWTNYVNFQNNRNYLNLLSNYYNFYSPTYLIYPNQHNNLIFQYKF